MLQYKRTLVGSAMASALLAGSAIAQAGDGFQLSDKLSVTGFIDMSSSYVKPDGGVSNATTGLDQFEMDFLYGFSDKMTGQVDMEYQDDGGVDGAGDPLGEELDIEQAFINYDLGSGFSVKGGRFLSYSGWEAEEPTGLFQYSGTGYAKYFYGGYQQGLSSMYSSKMFDVAISVVNSLGDLQGQARDSSNPGSEVMLAIHPVDFWTLKIFQLTDKDMTTYDTVSSTNIWTSFTFSGVTLAVEANTAKNTAYADSEASGGLFMANYAWDKYGITLRFHAWDVEDGTGTKTEDMSGITLAPNVKVNDNLLLIFEIRQDDDKLADVKTDTYALEATVTF